MTQVRSALAGVVRGAGSAASTTAPARGLLTRTRRARGRALVLLWHRISPAGAAPHDVIPTVPTDLFRRQLTALAAVGDIVPLAATESQEAGRPRFAVTFDDDDPGHVRHALPVLRELGVPATFFLSGRWLRDLGPYWWEVLEHDIAAEGLARVAARLGLPATSAPDLAAAVQGTPHAEELAERGRRAAAHDVMTADDAGRLVAAGMEIGFHTLHHPALTELSADDASAALVEGRADLEAAVGQPVVRFAYPHGLATPELARVATAAGYTSAWTSDHQPVDVAAHPCLRGRWEPGPRPLGALVRGVLRRLNLPRR